MKANEAIKAFLDSWNNHRANTPIREADLKNPNEVNFRNWLILLLSDLNVNTFVFNNMENESGARLKASRCKLVYTVNHFLNIANPKLPVFCFMDLVTPKFRTVFNTLKFLLNYVLYVKLKYETTIVECAKMIEERHELRTQKNQLRKNIEEAKIKAENCVKTFKDLERKIPQQKSIILELQSKEDSLRKEIIKIEQEMEKFDMKLIELKTQIQNINENLVDDQEAESILASKENVQQQLEEQEDMIAAQRQKLKENSMAIEKVQALTNKMEAIQSSFAFDTVDIKNIRKNREELEANIASLKNFIKQYKSESEQLIQTLKLRKENINKLTQKKREFEETVCAKDKENVKILKHQSAVLRKLCIKEDELLTTKQRIKDELDLLYKISSNIIKQMSESFYFC